MLRVVRDPPVQRSPAQKEPMDDPRVVALLTRLTINSKEMGKDYMFCPDDATLITWGLRGYTFSDADLEAVDAWLRENNPIGHPRRTVSESLCWLDAFVAEQLAGVANPAWLQDPLNVFTAQTRAIMREHCVSCNLRILRAVFVAFLTIRA